MLKIAIHQEVGKLWKQMLIGSISHGSPDEDDTDFSL